MSNLARKIMLAWNCIALAAFVLGYLYTVCYVRAMGAPLQVTALDRAGVIDETKLRQSYPDLAQDLRLNLGLWIAEKELRTARIAFGAGIAFIAANLLLMLLLGRRKKLSPAAPPTSS